MSQVLIERLIRRRDRLNITIQTLQEESGVERARGAMKNARKALGLSRAMVGARASKPKRKMSAKAKKLISARMTKYWAEKRATKNKA